MILKIITPGSTVYLEFEVCFSSEKKIVISEHDLTMIKNMIVNYLKTKKED